MNTAGDTLPPGTTLGQYKLLEPAARGGFGVLYRAWDEKLKRPVAVKECFPVSICHRDPSSGFVRPHNAALQAQYDAAINDVFEEAQTLSGLHHAHVVPVYDIFWAAGNLFYVMPWLEGGSLRDKISAGESISAEKSARWLLCILAALEYLHSRQIIHRDLKPGNIMFDADGNPVLVDFGSALNRATKVDTTTQGEFSPVYASPEQISGKGKIGPWTDLYSLAATWYELLSSSAPEPVQQRLVKDELIPLPSGPSVLEQSIMQNLSLSASERCQTAQEWQEWLQAGQTPVAIARKRRMGFIWGIPLLLLGACGIFYTGTRMAEPASEKTEHISHDTLYQQVCEQLKLNDLARELSLVTSQYHEVLQEHEKKATPYKEAMKLPSPGQKVQSRGGLDMEKLRQSQKLRNEYNKIHKESFKQIAPLRSRGKQAAAVMMNSIYSLEASYPWETAQDLAMLKKIQIQLEKEFKPYQDKFEEADSQASKMIQYNGLP